MIRKSRSTLPAHHEHCRRVEAAFRAVLKEIQRVKELNPGDEDAEWLQPFTIMEPTLRFHAAVLVEPRARREAAK